MVVYDESCALCRRCRHWLEWQPTYLPLEFLTTGAAREDDRYAGVPWLGAELVVVDEAGEVWVGAAAFLVCLWATRGWRSWAYRLSGPAFAPLAERFFYAISAHRGRISTLLLSPANCPDAECRHGAAAGR